MDQTDHVAETFRVKLARDEETVKYCRKKKTKQKGDDFDFCSDSFKTKKCRGAYKKGKKNPSFNTLTKSVSKNCCACCCVLAAYIKETHKLISCCGHSNRSESRLCELFWQIIELSWCLGHDVYNLLRYCAKYLWKKI